MEKHILENVGFLRIFGGFSGPFLADFLGRFRMCLIQCWRFFWRFLEDFPRICLDRIFLARIC